MREKFSTGRLSKESQKFYVYTLIDPFTREPMYVGITSNIKDRKSRHYRNRNCRDIPVFNWITTLHAAGTRPIFNVVAEYNDYKTAASMERTLINGLRGSILNVRDNPCFVK